MLKRDVINGVELYCEIMVVQVRKFATFIARDIASGVNVWNVASEADGPPTVLVRWAKFRGSEEFWMVGPERKRFVPPSPSASDVVLLELMRLPDCGVRVAGDAARNAHEFIIQRMIPCMIRHTGNLKSLHDFISELDKAGLLQSLRREAEWLRQNAIVEFDIPKWIVCQIFDDADLRTVKKILKNEFEEIGQSLRISVEHLPPCWEEVLRTLTPKSGKQKQQIQALIRHLEATKLARNLHEPAK